ncbi:MAG: tetratricopeptide repeat protein [Alphaproteobacteria bacterium]|nr:tetratricopeptide repeat protein [Alphaproteobacteria bacterium]
MDRQVQVGRLIQTARAHHTQGALGEAIALYQQALRMLPGHADLMHLIAVAYLQAGRFDESEQWLKKVLKAKPSFAEAYTNLGAVYRSTGRIDKAIDACRSAIRLAPKMANAHFNLGRSCFDAKDFTAAIAAFEVVLSLVPDDAEAMLNLGASLMQQPISAEHHWRKILGLFERVLDARPRSVEALANIGQVYSSLGWLSAALSMYERGLAFDPASQRLKYLRAGVLLMQGQLNRGWEDYEFRTGDLGGPKVIRRKVPPQYWGGESLAGRTIFLWPEQGLGDQVIYSSAVPEIIAKAGKVYIESKPRLTRVYQRSFPAAVVLGRRTEREPVTPPKDCDYQIGFGSVGRFLRTDFSHFPKHSGYLRADEAKVARFRDAYREKAGARRIIGLSWRSRRDGVGVYKSSDLLEWSGILESKDAWFVNLQYGDCTQDLANVKRELGVEVFQDLNVNAMGDLDDFFAQVAATDLVLSTSSTTVHVAGALNIPAWVLLPRSGAGLWYWFLERTDSPWYPSLRFYRQSEDDLELGRWWHQALERMTADFKHWLTSV